MLIIQPVSFIFSYVNIGLDNQKRITVDYVIKQGWTSSTAQFQVGLFLKKHIF